MDFNSLGEGSPVYILTKPEKTMPELRIGTLKSKVIQQPQYNMQVVPNALNGINSVQKLNIVVKIGDMETSYTDVPVNVEIAQKGNDTFTGSREAIIQAIDAMMQKSKMEIENTPYNESVLKAGEGFLEQLNPNYAAQKEQARTIEELKAHRKETDEKLDSILAILKKLDSPAPRK